MRVSWRYRSKNLGSEELWFGLAALDHVPFLLTYYSDRMMLNTLTPCCGDAVSRRRPELSGKRQYYCALCGGNLDLTADIAAHRIARASYGQLGFGSAPLKGDSRMLVLHTDGLVEALDLWGFSPLQAEIVEDPVRRALELIEVPRRCATEARITEVCPRGAAAHAGGLPFILGGSVKDRMALPSDSGRIRARRVHAGLCTFLDHGHR